MIETVHPVLQRLFRQRQFDDLAFQEFLSWDLKQLPDLTSMNDLHLAAERIIEALIRREKIGIYGDYDVDGTTSCALFFHFFRLLEVEVETFQPGRFSEGYGLHLSSIDKACDREVNVLITVDCGITNNEAALYAREKNLDLIITDHHKDIREEIPRAYAVVNPNRRDEPAESPLKTLAGVGVAFAVCLKVKKLLEMKGHACPSIYPLLQFVAVGTLCDLALLNPLNIKLVRHGLKQICDQPYPGLKIFLKPEDTLKKKFVQSEKISFNIGPLINSKGRLDHPERALKVLISDSLEEAREHYLHLEVSNRERKAVQANVYQEAVEQVLLKLDQVPFEERTIHILYNPHWHEGVIGIVAAKLVESFKIPAIIFTQDQKGHYLKASARTAGTLDIFACLKSCQDLFVKFGGHQAAAGLTMKKENLPFFIERMQELLKAIPSNERIQKDRYDLDVEYDEMTPSLAYALDSLEPFGRGNPKPIFRMSGIKLESYTILKDVHVRWQFSKISPVLTRTIVKRIPIPPLKGISFNYMGKKDASSPEDLVSQQKPEGLTVQFSLGINSWGGNDYLQLMVDKVLL